MVYPFSIGPLHEDDPAARRAFGRRRQESLKTDLGPVLDLSRGGMRIATRRPLEGEVDLTLTWFEGDLDLRAEVKWTKKVGFRRYEAGLQFVGLDKETAEQLAAISTLHQIGWQDTG